MSHERTDGPIPESIEISTCQLVPKEAKRAWTNGRGVESDEHVSGMENTMFVSDEE